MLSVAAELVETLLLLKLFIKRTNYITTDIVQKQKNRKLANFVANSY